MKWLFAILVMAWILRIKEIPSRLLGLDSWYHYRMADYILTYGSRPDVDMLSHAPQGSPVTVPFLYEYLLVAWYKLTGILGGSLMGSALMLPVLFGVLSVYVAYLLGREWRDEKTGLYSAFLVAVVPAFLIKSTAGAGDSDSLVYLLILLALWGFIRVAKIINTPRSERNNTSLPIRVVLAFYLLPFFLLGLAWNGAYFFAFILVFFLVLQFKHKKFINFLFISISTWIYLLGGILIRNPPHTEIFRILFQDSVIAQTVSEMQPPAFQHILSNLWILPLLAVAGVYLSLRSRRDYDPLLLGLLVISLFGSALSMRFLLLLSIPLCFYGGYFLASITLPEKTGRWFKIENKLRDNANLFIPLVLAVSLAYPSSLDMGDFQVVDDELYDTLLWINGNVHEDTVILMWWDLGHPFTAVAGRAVVLDNAPNQGVVPSADERARDIARFLVGGPNICCDILEKYGVDYIFLYPLEEKWDAIEHTAGVWMPFEESWYYRAYNGFGGYPLAYASPNWKYRLYGSNEEK